jgi:hypothetical protein
VHFNNGDGLLAKTITFNYNDKTAVAGLPQVTFILVLTIVIVVIVIIIVAVLLLRRRPKETLKPA